MFLRLCLYATKLNIFLFCILQATVEPMQIDTGPEDSDANRVMVESTTLVNVYTLLAFELFM